MALSRSTSTASGVNPARSERMAASTARFARRMASACRAFVRSEPSHGTSSGEEHVECLLEKIKAGAVFA